MGIFLITSMKNTLSIRLAAIMLVPLALAFIAPAVVAADTVKQPFTYDVSASVCKAPETVDNRAERLDTYFKERDMPLAGYGSDFIAAADGCGMDWRLLPAIGVRESSGGKHLLNNNPFGWGSAKIPFKNFSEAIKEVASNLCGNDKDTAAYYKNKTIDQKLWFYNGSVMPSYPREVVMIMNRF